MQDHSTTVVETAACTTGRCSACRGTVYTLTKGLGSPLSPCEHGCHDPAPVDPEQELDDLLADEADRLADWDWS
jgi:hypothetical protein